MLYILLPIHNRKLITEKFIQCLKMQSEQNYQLILIDDGSIDGTDEMVLKNIPNTKVIYGDGNLWWAGSLQKGYDFLKNKDLQINDKVLLINDDTEFTNDFLTKGCSLVDSNPKILLKSWSVDKYNNQRSDGYIHFEQCGLIFKDTDKKSANCISTRGVFLNAKDFIDIGGFMPKKLPHYLSDYEWAIRAHKKGYSILCDDGLSLVSDSAESGYHIIDFKHFKTIKEFKKKLFSIKNPDHPRYFITFNNLQTDDKLCRLINNLKIILRLVKRFLLAYIYFWKKTILFKEFREKL